MYLPEAFREERVEVLHEMMRTLGAATLISHGSSGLIASQLPIVLDDEPRPWGRISCHLARANSHLDWLRSGGEHMLVFQGPQGYVSPSWYPSKQETEKVVPTWNYVAVHAYGVPLLFEGPAEVRSHLARLTDQFEADRAAPWSIDDAPADFIDALCKGVVGVAIDLSRIEGKWKLSQNRPGQDRLGVVEGLRAEGGDANAALSALVDSAGSPSRNLPWRD